MSDHARIETRLALAMHRKNLMARRSVLESRLIHWQAFIRGAAALSRDYAHDDAALSKFMIDVTFRGAQQEKAINGELSSINLQIEGATRDLSVIANSDDWRTLRDQAKEEQGD